MKRFPNHATDHGVEGCENLKDVAKKHNLPYNTVTGRYRTGKRGSDLIVAKTQKKKIVLGKSMEQWSWWFALQNISYGKSAIHWYYNRIAAKHPDMSDADIMTQIVEAKIKALKIEGLMKLSILADLEDIILSQ